MTVKFYSLNSSSDAKNIITIPQVINVQNNIMISTNSFYNIDINTYSSSFENTENGLRYIGDMSITMEISFQLRYTWDFLYQLNLIIELYKTYIENGDNELIIKKVAGINDISVLDIINTYYTSMYIYLNPGDIIHLHIHNVHNYTLHLLKDSFIIFRPVM